MARVKFTAGMVRDFACPTDKAQAFLWDANAPGLAIRATPPGKRNPAGSKAYVFQSKLGGNDIRLTIGDVRSWDIASAQAEARRLGTLIDRGIDPRAEKQERIQELRAEAKRAETTFAEALKEYVKGKRRKDGLQLKQRTIDDYLGMVDESRKLKNGKTAQAGSLYALANKSLHNINADDIRATYKAIENRGERQAAYAMQVLRAVFNWHGVKIPDNPLGKEVAGRDRITIPAPKATGKPIPSERIGAWWLAVEQSANPSSRDYFRFLLLTGARVSEPKNILVSDCDLQSGRVTIRDTKNRKDHVILLSRQAAEIVERNIAGKQPDAALFVLASGRKTIGTIIRRSGVVFRAKDLRSTFASVAGGLVTAYALKAMMNHAGAGDVTGIHYVRLNDEDLRAGWQAVADFIESKAKEVALPAEIKDLAEARKRRSKTAA